MAARVAGADLVALLLRETVVVEAQHVHLDAGGHQGDDRPLVPGDARRGMQGDGVPDVVDIAFGNPVGAEEIGGGIGAVDLETLGRAGIGRLQPHVVEHRPDIEQFRIDHQALALAGQGTPKENPA